MWGIFHAFELDVPSVSVSVWEEVLLLMVGDEAFGRMLDGSQMWCYPQISSHRQERKGDAGSGLDGACRGSVAICKPLGGGTQLDTKLES